MVKRYSLGIKKKNVAVIVVGTWSARAGGRGASNYESAGRCLWQGLGQFLVLALAFWRDPSGTRDTGSGRGSKGLETSGTVRVGVVWVGWERRRKNHRRRTPHAVFSDQGGWFRGSAGKAWRGAPSSFSAALGQGLAVAGCERTFWRAELTHVPRGYCVGTGCTAGCV